MKLKIFLCLLFINLIICYSQTLEENFKKITDSIFNTNKDVNGFLIHIESPDNKISWSYAAGFNDKINPLKKTQPVLIASVTKTYVAASILKLIENGQLKLEQPIHNLLCKKSQKLFSQTDYNLNKITIKNLLSHSSGIADYVDDTYFEFVKNNLNYQWERNEQIALALNKGKKIAEAGVKFKYADINYLLLTEIIEKITKKPFYLAIRTLLNFKKNKLDNTWFVQLEEKPKNLMPLAHQYYKKYSWDSYKINPSWDLFGGGGIASTTKDVSLFFHKLFTSKIIKDKNILKQMTTYVLPKETAAFYCLGIKKINFSGFEAYYHGGFWGTDVMYIPSLNTTITTFVLEKEKRMLNAITSKKIIDLLIKNKNNEN